MQKNISGIGNLQQDSYTAFFGLLPLNINCFRMKYATYKLRISFLMSIFASEKTLYMKFVRAIAGYNHLWAVRDEAKEADELTMLF